MRKFVFVMAATVVLCGALAGCGQRKAAGTQAVGAEDTAGVADVAGAADAREAAAESYLEAIDRYLTEEIAPGYQQGEICIPFHTYVAVDERNADDILVRGDFWVMNYEMAGDTLKTVSGGNHPGMMHVRQFADGHFEVTGFDGVEDGAAFTPSAKQIFGSRYDEFLKVNSDQERRERTRAGAIGAYVRAHGLPARLYKDFGWPAVEIPRD